MTKKHFIALGDTIRNARISEETRTEITPVLADFCQTQNARFNRSRWVNYVNGLCGPNGGKRNA